MWCCSIMRAAHIAIRIRDSDVAAIGCLEKNLLRPEKEASGVQWHRMFYTEFLQETNFNENRLDL